MSFMNKMKAGLGEVGNQAKGLARSVGEGSKQVASGFKLENECEKAAKILASFLAGRLLSVRALSRKISYCDRSRSSRISSK